MLRPIRFIMLSRLASAKLVLKSADDGFVGRAYRDNEGGVGILLELDSKLALIPVLYVLPGTVRLSISSKLFMTRSAACFRGVWPSFGIFGFEVVANAIVIGGEMPSFCTKESSSRSNSSTA